MAPYADKLTQAREQIARGRFEPVYILFGSDIHAVDELIHELKRRLIAPGFEAFDLVECHAEDVPVIQALQHLRQPAVASSRKLVILREVGDLRKPQLDELCTGLARLPEGSTAVLTAAWDKDLADAFAAAGLTRFVLNLKPPQGTELDMRLRHWATDLKLRLDPDAVALLVELAGDDTAVLRGEIEKIATAVEPGTTIDAAAVRRMAGRTREFELREYVARLLEADVPAALEVLSRLAAWGEQPQHVIAFITTGLLGQAAKLARDPGSDRRESSRHLRRALHRLYDINRASLTGHPEPFVLLETFTICLSCSHRAQPCRLHELPAPPEFCVRRPRRRSSRATR